MISISADSWAAVVAGPAKRADFGEIVSKALTSIVSARA